MGLSMWRGNGTYAAFGIGALVLTSLLNIVLRVGSVQRI